MTSETEPNLAIGRSDTIDRTRLTWPKRITIIIALLGAYAPFFFHFLVPSELLFLGLLAIGAVFAIPLAAFSLYALFRPALEADVNLRNGLGVAQPSLHRTF